MWQNSFEDGTFIRLKAMDPISDIYVGWMGEFDPITQDFTYIAGMLFTTDTVVPHGFDSREIAACAVAVGWIQGMEPDIYTQAHTLTEEAMKENGHAPDYSQCFSMEVYDQERFGAAVERGESELTAIS